MFDVVEKVVRNEPRVEYAIVFGSHARGTQRKDSDMDIAIAVSQPMQPQELLDLMGRLESATGGDVDLVLVDEAPPALAYRVFKEGVLVFDRNHASFVRRKTRAILDYLDFKPIEEILTRGAIAAAKRG